MVCFKTSFAEKIKKILEVDFKVGLANGQDHLKGNILRMSNMGLITPNQLLIALNSLEVVLEKLKVRDFNGEAARVFTKEYYL